MSAASGLADRVGVRAACEALGLPRPSYYRWQRPKPRAEAARRPPLKRL